MIAACIQDKKKEDVEGNKGQITDITHLLSSIVGTKKKIASSQALVKTPELEQFNKGVNYESARQVAP